MAMDAATYEKLMPVSPMDISSWVIFGTDELGQFVIAASVFGDIQV